MVPDTDVISVIEETKKMTVTSGFDSDEKAVKNIGALKEKISRTSQFLQELKVLSKDCQELEQDQEKDKQIFSRRTVQLGAEIQDARDLLSAVCKDRLPERQWLLLFDANEGVLETELNGFDMDPSVQFFGIDWERVFGRCFSLGMHVNLLESAILEHDVYELDLVLINKMLRELTAIEADVLSHSEAVLRGRLSKSQRKLIFDEQNKYASLTVRTPSIKVISDSFSIKFRNCSGSTKV